MKPMNASAKPPAAPQDLLLVRLGGLGDLLAILPSVRLIRGKFPDARLTLACREKYGALFSRAGLVDALENGEGRRFSGLFVSPLPDPLESTGWLAGFDFALGWMQGPAGGELEANLRRLGIAARFIFRVPRSTEGVAQSFFDQTARLFGRAAEALSFESFSSLPIDEETRRLGRLLAQRSGLGPRSPFAIVHPGAGSRRKRWPLGNFLAVVEILSAQGLPGLIMTGEAEADLRRGLEEATLPPGWESVAGVDLVSLAGLLSECGLYLGNDSGVTHLAAACGAKAVAVFLKEFENAWRPYGNSIVLGAERIEMVPVDEVARAVMTIVGGKPRSGA